MSFSQGVEYAKSVANRSNVLRLPSGITDTSLFLKGFLYERTFVHSAGKPNAKNPVKVVVQFNARKVDGALLTAVNRWLAALSLGSINPAPKSLEKKGEWIIAMVRPDHISKVLNSICSGLPDGEEKKKVFMDQIESKRRQLENPREESVEVVEPETDNVFSTGIVVGKSKMKMYPIYTKTGELKGYIEA